MADSRARKTFLPTVPHQDRISDTQGFASRIWQEFFRGIFDRLIPLGAEQSFDMIAGQSLAADIVGLSFDYMNEQSAVVDFFIQRVSVKSAPLATDAQELVEVGTLYLRFSPRSKTWAISKLSIPTPGTSNVTITVVPSTGQVQYKSTALTGVPDVDKITWRSRVLKAKISKAQGVWT